MGGRPGSGSVVAEFGIRHLKAEEAAGGPAGAFAPRGSAARRGLPPTRVLRKEKGKGRRHVKVGIFPNRKQPASLSFKRNFPARRQHLRPGLQEQRPGTCHRTSCQPSPLQTKRVGFWTKDLHQIRFSFPADYRSGSDTVGLPARSEGGRPTAGQRCRLPTARPHHQQDAGHARGFEELAVLFRAAGGSGIKLLGKYSLPNP